MRLNRRPGLETEPCARVVKRTKSKAYQTSSALLPCGIQSALLSRFLTCGPRRSFGRCGQQGSRQGGRQGSPEAASETAHLSETTHLSKMAPCWGGSWRPSGQSTATSERRELPPNSRLFLFPSHTMQARARNLSLLVLRTPSFPRRLLTYKNPPPCANRVPSRSGGGAGDGGVLLGPRQRGVPVLPRPAPRPAPDEAPGNLRPKAPRTGPRDEIRGSWPMAPGEENKQEIKSPPLL